LLLVQSDYWALEYTDKLAEELITSAVKQGITFFDTAEGYADGDSERQLKRVLAKLDKKDRSKVLIGSKILPNNALDCRKALLGTLKRLDIECIDLYMVHWPITAEAMAHFAGDHKTESGGKPIPRP
jgi:diketogulonate reductase-like aldo/keto reductase